MGGGPPSLNTCGTCVSRTQLPFRGQRYLVGSTQVPSQVSTEEAGVGIQKGKPAIPREAQEMSEFL